MKAILIPACFLFFSLIGLNAQNVGIGTNDPKAKLHVKSDQGLVTAFYDGFNEGVINPAYQEGNKNWQIITDDPPIGPYGVGAPSSMKNNETAILSFSINTPIGKDVRISFSANHNDPDSHLSFSLQKPGNTFYVDHQPNWKNYTTNFIATTNPSTIKFRLQAETDVPFSETFLDEIKVTYIPDPVLMIDDGTQMSGGILQSDAFGNASWVDLRSEIDQQVNQSNQDLSFNTTSNKLSIENGNTVDIAGLSNTQSNKLSLKVDTILTSPGMHLKIPAFQDDQSAFHYNADRASVAWGIAPISNSYTDAQHSVRWGSNNKVYGEHGSVWGQDNIITFTGKNSTVFGINNNVAGLGSTAWGDNNNIEADSLATVWGQNNTASGKLGTAWGQDNIVSGIYGTAWGQSNLASGHYSTASGYKSIASGTSSFAYGIAAEASGTSSIAIGSTVSATSYREIALGYNNKEIYPFHTSSWDSRDMLFSIGNGQEYGGEGNNALSILKSGYIGINMHNPGFQLDMLIEEPGFKGIRINNTYDGELESGSILKMYGDNQIIYFNGRNQLNMQLRHNTSSNNLYIEKNDYKLFSFTSLGKLGIDVESPSYDLHLGNNSAAKPASSSWIVASDRRLKQNIKPFEGGLDLVKKINPVWFTYNGRASMPQETGVGTIAQELESVAPYMVKDWERDGEKYKAVDYGAMDFILVNAIKEQQQQIETLMEIVEKQGKIIEELQSTSKKSVASN